MVKLFEYIDVDSECFFSYNSIELFTFQQIGLYILYVVCFCFVVRVMCNSFCPLWLKLYNVIQSEYYQFLVIVVFFSHFFHSFSLSFLLVRSRSFHSFSFCVAAWFGLFINYKFLSSLYKVCMIFHLQLFLQSFFFLFKLLFLCI